MKKLFVLMLFAGINGAFAQTKPFQFSVVHQLSTHGKECKNTDFNFSFNLISGEVNSIKGVEIGSLYNQNNGDMMGFQTSGIMNLTKGSVMGFQNAGVLNIAGDVKGIQLSGIFNKAKILRGFQIGVINVADSVENGGGIGLINLYKKGGYREVEVSASDYQNVGLSFKSGTRNLYMILNVGYNFLEAPLFSGGAGIGGVLNLKKNWFFKPEIIASNYITEDLDFDTDINTFHFRFGIMKKINRIGISLYPSVYYANISKNLDGDLTKISPIKAFKQTDNGRWGFGIGLGLAFLK